MGLATCVELPRGMKRVAAFEVSSLPDGWMQEETGAV